jgi:hypothetical protein
VSDPVYQSIVTGIKRGKSVAKLQKGHPGQNLLKCLAQKKIGFR